MNTPPFFNRRPAHIRKAFWRGFFVVVFWALLVFGCAWLGGCATRVYSPDGRPALNIYSDFKGRMSYRTKTLQFEFDGIMDNSRPTRTAGDVVSKGLISAGVGGAGIAP